MNALASNLKVQKMPASYVEPIEAPSVCPGKCLWCGERVRGGRRYCDAACRVEFNNWLTRKAKPMMLRLLVWRATRGRKGTPGAGMLSEVAQLTDAAMKETHARHRQHKAALAEESK